KKMFNEMFPGGIFKLTNGEIRFNWNEEDDIYFHYSYYKSDIQADNSETGLLLKALIKPITVPDIIESNDSHICWFIPEPLKANQKFKDLDKSEIIRMYLDESYMKNFIEGLIEEEKKFRTKLMAQIEAMKQTSRSYEPTVL